VYLLSPNVLAFKGTVSTDFCLFFIKPGAIYSKTSDYSRKFYLFLTFRENPTKIFSGYDMNIPSDK
jgi:hypothetical protein